MCNIDVYNLRKYNLDLSSGNYNEWLNSEAVKKSHSVPLDWNFYACNEGIYNDFVDSTDIMTSVTDSLLYALDRIPVLLYNGQDDWIINT